MQSDLGDGPQSRERDDQRKRMKDRAERLLDKVEEKTKGNVQPQHENDFENVQLNSTSNDMISLFLDGFEHERWDEYFCRWRGHQHRIA